MPTTSVEKLSPTRAKLTISVTPEELKPSITHAYSHIAEQVNVPGFRKGKVPPPIIDQRVGKAAVLEHAVNEGLDGFFRAAVAEHELRPLGKPEADIVEWPSEKDFSGDLLLAIEVDVRPDIELPDYDGLELTVDSVEVGDDEVAEELDRLRSRFGTLITVDRPAKTGDFVTLDLVAMIDGHRGRHRERHLVRARLGRADRGHRRGARHALGRRDHHLRVEAARRRPRGRDRRDHRHGDRGQGARAPRGRRRLRADRERVRHARRADRQPQAAGRPQQVVRPGQPGPRPPRRQAPRARRGSGRAERHRRRGAPSPRERETDSRTTSTAQRSPRRARRRSRRRSCSTRSPRPRRSRSARTS